MPKNWQSTPVVPYKRYVGFQAKQQSPRGRVLVEVNPQQLTVVDPLDVDRSDLPEIEINQPATSQCNTDLNDLFTGLDVKPDIELAALSLKTNSGVWPVDTPIHLRSMSHLVRESRDGVAFESHTSSSISGIGDITTTQQWHNNSTDHLI